MDENIDGQSVLGSIDWIYNISLLDSRSNPAVSHVSGSTNSIRCLHIQQGPVDNPIYEISTQIEEIHLWMTSVVVFMCSLNSLLWSWFLILCAPGHK